MSSAPPTHAPVQPIGSLGFLSSPASSSGAAPHPPPPLSQPLYHAAAGTSHGTSHGTSLGGGGASLLHAPPTLPPARGGAHRVPCSRPTAHRAPLLRPTRPSRTSRAADVDAATACVVDSPTGAAAATAAREAAPYIERHSASPNAPASTRPTRAAAPRAELLLHSALAAAAAAAPPAATPAARAASSCIDFLAQRSFGPASLPSGASCAARASAAAGQAGAAEDAEVVEAAEAAQAAGGPVVCRSAAVSIASAQRRPFDSFEAAPPVYRRPPHRALRCTPRPTARTTQRLISAPGRPPRSAADACAPVCRGHLQPTPCGHLLSDPSGTSTCRCPTRRRRCDCHPPSARTATAAATPRHPAAATTAAGPARVPRPSPWPSTASHRRSSSAGRARLRASVGVRCRSPLSGRAAESWEKHWGPNSTAGRTIYTVKTDECSAFAIGSGCAICVCICICMCVHALCYWSGVECAIYHGVVL
jgi:hypothetical protein